MLYLSPQKPVDNLIFVIAKYPVTRLGMLVNAGSLSKILSYCDEYVPEQSGHTSEYFFDRNPENFAAILNFYRTDKFHVTGKGCSLVLQKGRIFVMNLRRN